MAKLLTFAIGAVMLWLVGYSIYRVSKIYIDRLEKKKSEE